MEIILEFTLKLWLQDSNVSILITGILILYKILKWILSKALLCKEVLGKLNLLPTASTTGGS